MSRPTQSEITAHFPSRKRTSSSDDSSKRLKLREGVFSRPQILASSEIREETPSKAEKTQNGAKVASEERRILKTPRRPMSRDRSTSSPLAEAKIKPDYFKKRYKTMAEHLKPSDDSKERKRLLGNQVHREPNFTPQLQKKQWIHLENFGAGEKAHEKFEYPIGLELPQHYETLAEKFHCVDTVASLVARRKAVCTFQNLKNSVQEMSRKCFVEKNLGQMKTVFPTAYTFCQEKGLPWYQSFQKKPEYQLTVRINPSAVEELEKGEEGEKTEKPITTSMLLERRKVFDKRLLDIVRRHHKTFLEERHFPVSDDDKIRRWHPGFNLRHVPDVEVSQLPEKPSVKHFMTANDVLEATKAMAPKVVAALESTAASSAEVKEASKVSPLKKTATMDSSDNRKEKNTKALQGISQSLIDRIRAKETKRIQDDMIRDPAVEKRLAMMERLPEMCHILRSLFVAERRAAIPFDNVTFKVRDSYSSGISQVSAGQHLELLGEIVPTWLKIVKIRGTKFIKVDKNADTGKVIEDIREKQCALRH